MSKRFKCFERLMVPYSDTKEQYGWTILYFRVGRFSFHWFTEYGEWFVYFGLRTRKVHRVVRLSSAGNYVKKYVRGDHPD